MNFRKLTVILVLTMLAAGPALAKKKPIPPGPHEAYGGKAEIVVRDLSYVAGSRNPRHRLDVYSNPHEGLWPAVVMIHGGAWFKGSKDYDNTVWLSQVLANSGYVVFNLDYRLAPGTKIKGQAEDVMAAVIWVKEHAPEYGGDPARIGVAGGSAGGHLGALVAWASDDPYFAPTGRAESAVDSEVLAAALYYPVLDLDRTIKDNGKFLAPLGRLLLVGSVGRRYREADRHLSPGSHAAAGLPPSLFLTGDADELHLYPQSVEYTEKLKALGVDARLFTAAGKKHGFTFNYWEPESVASAEAMVALFDQYLKP